MWLIDQTVYEAMQKARHNGLDVTASQHTDFQASRVPMCGIKKDRSAHIPVTGVLTNAPDLFASIFGGGNTVYSELSDAVNAADQDPDISEIVLEIDSGGGQVKGLFQAIDIIKSTKKRVTALVTGNAASAAYAIAAAADTIVATSRAVEVGSIGVVVSAEIDANVIDITSTDAPFKRPDPNTEDGKAAIVEHLDAWHELFVEAIAEGRGITAEVVNKDFGRGGMLLAD